jgi:uncharacterized protein
MIFEKPGASNTDQTLAAAFQRGKQLGLDEVVVSSTSGKTAFKALDVFAGFRLTVVTYHCGFREPFKTVMPDDVKRDLEKKAPRWFQLPMPSPAWNAPYPKNIKDCILSF